MDDGSLSFSNLNRIGMGIGIGIGTACWAGWVAAAAFTIPRVWQLDYYLLDPQWCRDV